MAAANVASDLVAAFAANAGSAGVFSDFDGTLSAIVDDPAEARPLAGAVDVLARLARTFRMVAVVSGRPGAFLAEHLGGLGVALHGLYGLEPVDAAGDVRCRPEARHWMGIVDQVATRAEKELPPEVGVERKGVSVAVHYRQHPDHEHLARRWAEAAASATGLLLHPARMSVELRPPLPHDKGLVVAELAAGLTHACFLGDDVGDLAAFDAMDALHRGGVTTAKVAVVSDELAPEMRQRADLVVEGPAGALALLEDVAARAEQAER